MFDNFKDQPVEDVTGREIATEEPGSAQAESPGLERFNTCRWRCAPDEGSYCTHRDVLPFAGKDGFGAEAWCPDCSFYKVRRTPKKRDRNEYGY